MNSQEQRTLCPVRIGGFYKGQRVIYILGQSNGWNVWTKDAYGNETMYWIGAEHAKRPESSAVFTTI